MQLPVTLGAVRNPPTSCAQEPPARHPIPACAKRLPCAIAIKSDPPDALERIAQFVALFPDDDLVRGLLCPVRGMPIPR